VKTSSLTRSLNICTRIRILYGYRVKSNGNTELIAAYNARFTSLN